jgi:DNA replication protein DnaC
MAVESYEKLMVDLKKLRLPAMIDMLDSYVKQAASSGMSYMDFLSGLVSEEVRHKEQRAVQSRIKSARFPVLKSLDDFDYAFQPSVNRKKLAELSSLRFIDNKENILFLGPPGIGKTHLSTGLGVRACESGYKVLFTTLNDMVSTLMASMADNSFPSKLRIFVQPSLLIIDEVGYLPVSKEGANFLSYQQQVVCRLGRGIGRQCYCVSHPGSLAASFHRLQYPRRQLQTAGEEERTDWG